MARPIKHRDKWRIRWLDAAGQRRSEVHITHDDAKFALRRHQQEADEVRRGMRKLRPEKRTVSNIYDYWIEQRVPRKKSGRDDCYIIEAGLRPALGHVNLEQVDTAVAVEIGWLQAVPRIRKPRVRIFDDDFRYLKTGDEVNRFLAAAKEHEGPQVFLFYATAIYTGPLWAQESSPNRKCRQPASRWIGVPGAWRLLSLLYFERCVTSIWKYSPELRDKSVRHAA